MACLVLPARDRALLLQQFPRWAWTPPQIDPLPPPDDIRCKHRPRRFQILGRNEPLEISDLWPRPKKEPITPSPREFHHPHPKHAYDTLHGAVLVSIIWGTRSDSFG